MRVFPRVFPHFLHKNVHKEGSVSDSVHQIEVLGGPLDGEFSDRPAGCDAFEHLGHLYRLDREDTGSYFWRYAGFVLVGGV